MTIYEFRAVCRRFETRKWYFVLSLRNLPRQHRAAVYIENFAADEACVLGT